MKSVKTTSGELSGLPPHCGASIGPLYFNQTPAKVDSHQTSSSRKKEKNITVEPTQPDWKIESSSGPQAAVTEPALSEHK